MRKSLRFSLRQSRQFVFVYLAKRIKNEKLNIKAIASSKTSHELATREKIPLIESKSIEFIDLVFDGADEIDPKKDMIKGRGGSLFREKILATSAKEMIVLVEEKKLVPFLGKNGNLPIEISSFAYPLTLELLKEEGYVGEIRKNKNSFFTTDNGNYIVDLILDTSQKLTIADQETLLKIPGVIETGLFFHLAGRIIVGYDKDHVEILT